MNKFYILFFFSIAAFSQTLVVIDENNKPIIGASIFSDVDNYITTDKNGTVRLDKFAIGDTINIKQYGFEEFKFIKSNLDKTITLFYDNELLDEVVISASKFSQNLEKYQKITQINKSTIEFTNPMTSADLLKVEVMFLFKKSIRRR